ncbi:MAG: protein kinase domain-containing protein [Gemmataceae bacterium]
MVISLPDAAEIARLSVDLGLLTEDQLRDVWPARTKWAGSAESLLRALEGRGYLTPWQSQKLLQRETEGYFLGGYRLLYLIASGSFGQVFRAEDSHSGDEVAIKVLRKRWSDDARCVELFEREGRLGQQLVHPHIVQILAVNRDVVTGQYFMVMEFVEGGNLKDFLAARQRLEAAEALRLLEDAVEGLAHAYDHGLTHRDIKPTNILISSQGSAKLVDFGLAGVVAAGEAGAAEVERSVSYATLEKATGVAAGDVRSDIFFLGCLLYEMLSGRKPLEERALPFGRRTTSSLQDIPKLNAVDLHLPASVSQLVETMMHLDPSQRHQTPRQLLDAIRAVRRDVEHASDYDIQSPTIFIVEANEKLRHALRERFKEMGYRVLLAADPARAWQRFQHQPFDVLVIDAGTSGHEGIAVFRRILEAAEQQNLATAGVLLLSEHQADWTQQIPPSRRSEILIRPVNFSQLYRRLSELLMRMDRTPVPDGREKPT